MMKHMRLYKTLESNYYPFDPIKMSYANLV